VQWFNGCEGFHGGGMMMGGMFLFWALLILLGFYLMKHYIGSTKHTNTQEILKARLAKGEITEDEFDRIIDKLK
jgi:putative membrane protein